MLEKLLSGPYVMFLGLLIWSAFLMRSAAAKTRQSRSRDVVRELQGELRAEQRPAETQVQRMEIRLHDYDRDVAGRVQTTMIMLDQMIAEADREIDRLEALRSERGGGLSLEHRRMVVHLAGAGYPKSEIAGFIGCPVEVVAHVLEDDNRPGQQAA